MKLHDTRILRLMEVLQECRMPDFNERTVTLVLQAIKETLTDASASK